MYILEPEVANNSSTVLTPLEAADVLVCATPLEDTEYTALLYYLQHTGQPYHAFDNFLHLTNSRIQSPHVQQVLHVDHDGCIFSCSQSHIRIVPYSSNPLTQSYSTGSIQVFGKYHWNWFHIHL